MTYQPASAESVAGEVEKCAPVLDLLLLLKAAGEIRNAPPFASDVATFDASPGAAVQRSGAEGALTWGSEEPAWSILTSI